MSHEPKLGDVVLIDIPGQPPVRHMVASDPQQHGRSRHVLSFSTVPLDDLDDEPTATEETKA